jgi:phage-related protein
MELFKLLGKISIDNSDANKALDDTSNKGNNAQSKLSKAFTGIGKGAVAVGKTIGAGMIAGGVAVAGLVTKSVQAYAEYEQLVGGVKTLFKDSASQVLEYANIAYKTAGLSANAYMETVTSFSASLLQSLGGDTAKAAEYADRAIIDMSDNANKMGTDMTMIQNAYQGFAKQNYTMLDNLKLGYGGTKEEMARLIADASKMTDVQKELGITVDESSMSFGNVVNAISVMQASMGIAGTTAAEAADTISGSMSSVKAAWANLMVSIADDNADFGGYMKNFVDSAAMMIENMFPRIQIALGGVVQLIDQLAPVIIGKFPELLSTLLPTVIDAAISLIAALVDAFPGIVSAITSVLPSLIGGFRDIFNGLVAALPTIVQVLLDALPTVIQLLVTALADIFVTLCTMLPEIIQPVLDAIPGLTLMLVACLIDSLPGIMDGIMQLVTALIEMLPQVYPLFTEGIVALVQMIVEYLPELIPMWVDALLSIITMLTEQFPQLLPVLVDALVQIVTILVEQLPVIIPMLIDAAFTLMEALIDALPTIMQALLDALPPLLKAVWDAIVMVFQNLPQWFKQLFESAVNLIKVAFSAVKQIFTNIWNSIKSIFSPVAEWFSSHFKAAKEKVVSAFSDVKDRLLKPFTQARDKIKEVADKIKGFFKGEISMPKIKLPHFSIRPSGWKIGDLLQGSIPSLGIDWYAKGGILKEPTLFDYNPMTGRAKVGGEAGDEAVAPISTLQQYVKAAVKDENNELIVKLERIISLLVQFFPEALTAMQTPMVCDTNGLAIAMAPAINTELGKIAIKKGRGR